MSGAKKVYVHLGDLVHLMIVPECFTRDASGYKEQLYPQSTLIRLHDTNRIAISDPQARLVQWDGDEIPSRPDPHAIARAALEKAEKRCDQIIAGFLSPEYSIGQPMASFAERFGAGECKDAIRALMEPAVLAEIVGRVK
jgi:hypothetical protein